MGVFGAIQSAAKAPAKSMAKPKPAMQAKPMVAQQAPPLMPKMGLGPSRPPMNPQMNQLAQNAGQIGGMMMRPQMQPQPQPQMPEGNNVIPSGPPQPMNQFARPNPMQQSDGIGPSFAQSLQAGGVDPRMQQNLMGQQEGLRQQLMNRRQMMD